MKSYGELPVVDPDTAIVDKELENRLARSVDAGALDWKVMCSPNNKTSSTEKRWVHNNVLRLHEQGRCSSDIIEAQGT